MHLRWLVGPMTALALVLLAYSSLRVECAAAGGGAVRGRVRDNRALSRDQQQNFPHGCIRVAAFAGTTIAGAVMPGR